MTILMSALFVILAFGVVWCLAGVVCYLERERFWRSLK